MKNLHAESDREVLTRPLESVNVDDEQLLQSRLSMIPGVRKVEISLFEGTLSVVFNPRRIALNQLQALLDDPDRLMNRKIAKSGANQLAHYGAYWALGLALGIITLAAVLSRLHTETAAITATLLYLGVVLLGAGIYYRAFKNLFIKEEVNIDFLVAFCVICALFLQLFMEAALITALVLAAKAMTQVVTHFLNSGSPLHTILGARTAFAKEDAEFREVPVADVREGQILLVRQGAMIPVDGIITSGMAEILEAGITGESAYRIREQGDIVYAGCIVQYGSFEMRAQHVGADISLSYVEKLVHFANTRKTTRQNIVDAAARICVYGIIPLVIFFSMLYGQYTGWDNEPWLRNVVRLALTAIIALTPFAIILCTPTALFAATRKAARQGIIFKSADVIERLRNVDALLLDKTGTLTYARPELAAVSAFAAHTEEEVLQAAALIEQKSNHPLAHAVMAFTQSRGIKPAPAERFLEFEGGGACAVAAGRHYKIGALWLMQDGRDIPEEVVRWLDQTRQQGFSAVLVATSDAIIGGIAFEDRIREDARKTLQSLRKIGIRRMVMVTGDNETVAGRLAAQLQLDDVLANCMPVDKLKQLAREKSRGFTAGMVGDGINDAPALAQAEIGIAMGAIGNDLAVEAADVALMSRDLQPLYETFRIARQTIRTIDFNIAISFLVNLALLMFVFPGYITIPYIVMAQASMVLIVLLSSLLLYVRPSKR